MIAISGEIRNNKYEKNEETYNSTEIIVESAEFCGNKNSNEEI